MGIDAEQLDQEADQQYAQMMGTDTPAPPVNGQGDKQAQPPAADEIPQPAQPSQPQSYDDAPPAPTAEGDNWQDKYTKAEESRKNAHALMTKATQEAAELRRGNDQLQQQLASLQQQVNQLQQQSPAAATATGNGQIQGTPRGLSKSLSPVFESVEKAQAENQGVASSDWMLLSERSAGRKLPSQQQEMHSGHEVRKHHPDVA